MSVLREWLTRVASIGRRSSARLDEELSFHRDMAERRLLEEGVPPDEARRRAAVEVGGAAQVREAWRDQSGLPMLDSIAQDVRYGLRILGRSPGFTLAAVLTLAIGIGANTAIFTIVDAVLLRPLPFPNAARLVTLGDRTESGSVGTVGYTTVLDWRERSRSFEQIALMRSWQPTLVVNGEAERIPAVRVTANYFDMLGVRPAIGRTFTVEEDRPDHWRVLLLSDGLWRRRFGADPAVVGRTVVMNDREYRVVGVMPADFEPLDAARFYSPAQLWAPVGYDTSFQDACRGCRHMRAFGLLRPGVTTAQAAAEMNTIREQQRAEHPSTYDEGSIAVLPLRDVITADSSDALTVLLGAVVFVLLIACANVANLLMARSLVRQRELAVRAALGAGRWRLVRQLLTEGLMLGVLGGVAGVALAWGAVSSVDRFAPVSLPRLEHASIDARILAFTVIVTLLTSLVFGLAPAWRTARVGAQRTLRIDARTTAGGFSRGRAFLVVADLAMALVLLAGAGLMLRTVAALGSAEAGFDPRNVLSMQFSLVGKAYAEDGAVRVFQQRFLEQARAIPGVESVALAGQIPFGGNRDCRGFHAKGRMKPNPADDPCIETYGVSTDYLRLMRIPLRAGRFFSQADTPDSQPVMVLSESTARLVFGTDDPIGAEIRVGNFQRGTDYTVVGVVGDTQHDDLTEPVTAAMYLPQSQFTSSFLVAVARTTGDPHLVSAPLRDILRRLDPSVPVYGVASLETLVADTAATRRFVMHLLAGFAGVAVLLAAIGLYGVVSYAVSQRTREFGVRVALGAQRGDVVRLVLGSGGALVAGGITAGLVCAVLAAGWLRSLLFGVSSLDPATFGAAVAVLLLTAVVAHVVPVRRALRIDPMTALRQD